MTTQSVSTTSVGAVEQASWLPLLIIVLAQLQMGFNINALPVSIGPIAEDLNAPATAISTALSCIFSSPHWYAGCKFGKLSGSADLSIECGRAWFRWHSWRFHPTRARWTRLRSSRHLCCHAGADAGRTDRFQLSRLATDSGAGHPGQHPAISSGVAPSSPAIATAFSWRFRSRLMCSFRSRPDHGFRPAHLRDWHQIDFVGVVLRRWQLHSFCLASTTSTIGDAVGDT